MVLVVCDGLQTRQERKLGASACIGEGIMVVERDSMLPTKLRESPPEMPVGAEGVERGARNPVVTQCLSQA